MRVESRSGEEADVVRRRLGEGSVCGGEERSEVRWCHLKAPSQGASETWRVDEVEGERRDLLAGSCDRHGRVAWSPSPAVVGKCGNGSRRGTTESMG
jgi:hypothetical protein